MGVFGRETPKNGKEGVSMACLGGMVGDGLEEVMGSKIILGELLCGGVHAEGVVEGRVGDGRGLEEGCDTLVSVTDDGECGGSSGEVGGERAAREVCVHVSTCEGSGRVECDSAWSCGVLFAVNEVAGFSWWG